MFQNQHTGGGISSSLVSSSLVVGGKPAAARLNHVKNQIEARNFTFRAIDAVFLSGLFCTSFESFEFLVK